MEENELVDHTMTPPVPSAPVAEEPQMSEIATIGNVFIEPENTFKDLKRKPRFIIAAVITALLITAYTFALSYKVGESGVRSFITDQINKSPRTDSLTADQKANAVEMQVTINKYTRFAVPVFIAIFLLIGGLLYWLGAKAFGGTGTFAQNLAVWIYAGLPPVVVSMLASFLVMALKSADDIDLAASQRGLINTYTNLSFLTGKTMPIVSTFIATFDIFAIWGWVLAAIGLSVVNKISKVSAWSLVFVIVFIGLIFRLLGAVFSGNPA